MAQSPATKRRKHLSPGEKEMVSNVYEGLRENDPDLSVGNAVKLCGMLTKVSESTVYACMRHAKTPTTECESSGTEETRGRKKITVDEDTCYAIRRIAHSFFFRNEPPTVKKISAALDKDPTLPKLSRGVLLRTMNQMQFRYLKRNRRSILIERDEIVLWRRNYLRQIKKFREEGRNVLYLDETWLNEGHTESKVWQDLSVESSRQAFLQGLSTGLKTPSGKGRRLIITHIGGEAGFLEGGLHCFESKKSGDYHEDMNADVFEKWFMAIVHRLEPGSVIVMDNAPYHSRRLEQQPTSAWRKGQLIEWLRNKDISHSDQMLKVELLTLARQHKGPVKYVVDEMAKSNNVEVIRLPPYHCELNPIELIWAQVKAEVAKRNRTFKLPDVKLLLEEALKNVTAENWKRCISHVKKEEERMWELDIRADVVVEPLIISLGEESEESDISDVESD